MEPSRQTAGRRQRALRALARDLDETLGPDRSRVVHAYPDGWTVRRLRRLADQRREGHLMRNCLRWRPEPDSNCYSLRDRDNLPHATFSVWRHNGRVLDYFRGGPLFVAWMIETENAAILLSPGREIKPAHRRRLRAYLNAGAGGARMLPATPAAAFDLIAAGAEARPLSRNARASVTAAATLTGLA